MKIENNEVGDDDASATYHVAGYAARIISRQKKVHCMRASVNILPLRYLHFVDASDGKDMMLALADCGGLLAPKQYCFAIYAIAVQVYTKL